MHISLKNIPNFSRCFTQDIFIRIYIVPANFKYKQNLAKIHTRTHVFKSLPFFLFHYDAFAVVTTCHNYTHISFQSICFTHRERVHSSFQQKRWRLLITLFARIYNEQQWITLGFGRKRIEVKNVYTYICVCVLRINFISQNQRFKTSNGMANNRMNDIHF